jgi:hypothetical protein
MKLIESKTLGTAAASIEFTSIPSTFTDLVVLASIRSTADGSRNMSITINGSTSGMTGRFLFGSGSATSTGADTRETGAYNPSSATANTFSNVSMYFPNYAGSTNKSWSVDSVTENNATAVSLYFDAKLWSNTAAITSLSFAGDSGDFVIGSTISLYGILKGSDGIVTTSP